MRQSNINISLSYNFTSSDYLWPWGVTFDLINKWGVPWCIYNPSLVEIHRSMCKVKPNVNLFFLQTTTDSGKRNVCQSFLLHCTAGKTLMSDSLVYQQASWWPQTKGKQGQLRMVFWLEEIYHNTKVFHILEDILWPTFNDNRIWGVLQGTFRPLPCSRCISCIGEPG